MLVLIAMWKDILGWEKYYEVSSYGIVRNKLTNHILSVDYSNPSGYARVTLYHNNKKQRYLLHRLVMETFVGKSELEVNHIDSDKTNNALSNLEYVTRKENETHCRLYGAKRKNYKPFLVIYSNGNRCVYQTREELSLSLGITRACVKMWLHKNNRGYEKYGIVSIEYIKTN